MGHPVVLSQITTIDPSTGETIERIAFMSAAQVEAKVAAVWQAAHQWRSSTFDRRSALLVAIAAKLRERREDLALLAVREMGKPIAQARAEIDKCATCCDYFAEHGAAMLAAQPAASAATTSYVAFRPLGTILAIMPWNFPYWQVIRAAAPALFAGNAMLLKHAENTTRCGLEIERLFVDAGAGDLFGTLLMTNDDVDALIADPRIAALTLTGSERAGIAVASAAGEALKKCVLELGGSDPFIVLADADLHHAAVGAVAGRFQNAGQSCIAAKRFIVEAPVYDAFLDEFVALTRAQRIGDPRNDETQIGPCARADLMQQLHAQVRDTVAAGGRLVLGGRPIDRDGVFYEPTIVADVKPGMRMFDEETFGPAAAVTRAETLQQAIELANATPYGLGASIWTNDIDRAQTIAASIDAGQVFINGIVQSDPRLPFGGVKRSGYGRELSAFGIHEFVNIQTIWVK
jgi:succinate-semialdehyde dehydrogenase/glutarate-semialdehyde dehydrogenase